MNKQRRIKLIEIESALSSLQATLLGIIDEEQDRLDNIPENLQGGERYSSMEEIIDTLQSASDCIDEALSSIQSARNTFST